jgi:hypothetical protein
MFYSDAYQHPSNGSDSWRWRIDWDWWVRSPRHSTHYEAASSGNYYCSLYKWWWSDTLANASSINVTQGLDYEKPYLKWEFKWHEYRVYRQAPSWSSQYYCSTWLRKFWLQMYNMWVQSILENISWWSLWAPGTATLCTHWQCWNSYSYVSWRTQTNKYSYASQNHWRDWYCYWYTLWN